MSLLLENAIAHAKGVSGVDDTTFNKVLTRGLDIASRDEKRKLQVLLHKLSFSKDLALSTRVDNMLEIVEDYLD